MKINDILKEENIGKEYMITNSRLEGRIVKISNFLDVEIEMLGKVECLEDVMSLIGIIDLEFEEFKLYKKVTGKEALLEMLLNDECVYLSEDFDGKYIIRDDKLIFVTRTGEYESTLILNDIFRNEWYVKRK